MTLSEIKSAVLTGNTVYWSTKAYRVIVDSLGQWLVQCDLNGFCFGLTWQDGRTMNGKEDEFFMEGTR